MRVITQVNQMREMLGTQTECCATGSPETRSTPRKKSPCQDDDGGQTLYRDAPRFFDPAALASIRLIVTGNMRCHF